MSKKLKLVRKLICNLINEARKSIMASLIQVSIICNCLTHLKFTNTQKEKLNRFDRRAENIIGNSFIVNTENRMHKYAVKTVKKCISGEIYKNFINDHKRL